MQRKIAPKQGAESVFANNIIPQIGGIGTMSTIENEQIVVKLPLEKGVRVVVVQDGNVIENKKLDAFEKCTLVIQDEKLIDMERTTRKRYRIAK